MFNAMNVSKIPTINFKVSFEHKERAKKCGLTWNINEKKWYKDDVNKYDLKEISKWFMIDNIPLENLSLQRKTLIKYDNIKVYNHNLRMRHFYK